MKVFMLVSWSNHAPVKPIHIYSDGSELWGVQQISRVISPLDSGNQTWSKHHQFIPIQFLGHTPVFTQAGIVSWVEWLRMTINVREYHWYSPNITNVHIDLKWFEHVWNTMKYQFSGWHIWCIFKYVFLCLCFCLFIYLFIYLSLSFIIYHYYI